MTGAVADLDLHAGSPGLTLRTEDADGAPVIWNFLLPPPNVVTLYYPRAARQLAGAERLTVEGYEGLYDRPSFGGFRRIDPEGLGASVHYLLARRVIAPDGTEYDFSRYWRTAG